MEYIPRLKKKYQDEVINNLRLNYKSVMQVPKLVKICLNQGVGSAIADKKQIESAQQEMSMIAGQKAMLTRSTKDISNFKLRKGMPVGVMVTLRGDQMYEFLDRLVTSTIPRIRDFNGIPIKGFDGRGNYTFGIKEQIAFPEISIDKISKITGMDITFVTNTDSDSEALVLLRELGLPFKANDDAEKQREKELQKKKEETRKVETKKESTDSDHANLEAKSSTIQDVKDKTDSENSIDNIIDEKNTESNDVTLEKIDNNQNSSDNSDKLES